MAIFPSHEATILLVDDSEDDVVLIGKAFQRASLTNPVHVVRDGEEALDYLSGKGDYADRKKHPLPDLILLDLAMPRVDGFGLLEWIRKQPGIQNIAVIVLTTSDQIPDVKRAYAIGANSFLVKPGEFEKYVELGKIIKEYWTKSVRSGGDIFGPIPTKPT